MLLLTLLLLLLVLVFLSVDRLLLRDRLEDVDDDQRR